MKKGNIIIDSHTHVFPDVIAEKATLGISGFYDLKMKSIGSVSALVEKGNAAGITHFVTCSVATAANQVMKINDFIADTVLNSNGKIIGLGAMHQDFPDYEGEVNRLLSKGLKGIKLHPDFQRCNGDDKRFYKLYEILEDRGIPLLIHSGDMRYDYSSPERIRRIACDFSNMKMIAAHFGGWSVWDEAERYLGDTGIYVDTCSSMYTLPAKTVKRLISVFGREQVLFGTDFPMWEASDELNYIEALDIDDEVREGILWKNAARLYNITL